MSYNRLAQEFLGRDREGFLKVLAISGLPEKGRELAEDSPNFLRTKEEVRRLKEEGYTEEEIGDMGIGTTLIRKSARSMPGMAFNWSDGGAPMLNDSREEYACYLGLQWDPEVLHIIPQFIRIPNEKPRKAPYIPDAWVIMTGQRNILYDVKPDDWLKLMELEDSDEVRFDVEANFYWSPKMAKILKGTGFEHRYISRDFVPPVLYANLSTLSHHKENLSKPEIQRVELIRDYIDEYPGINIESLLHAMDGSVELGDIYRALAHGRICADLRTNPLKNPWQIELFSSGDLIHLWDDFQDPDKIQPQYDRIGPGDVIYWSKEIKFRVLRIRKRKAQLIGVDDTNKVHEIPVSELLKRAKNGRIKIVPCKTEAQIILSRYNAYSREQKQEAKRRYAFAMSDEKLADATKRKLRWRLRTAIAKMEAKGLPGEIACVIGKPGPARSRGCGTNGRATELARQVFLMRKKDLLHLRGSRLNKYDTFILWCQEEEERLQKDHIKRTETDASDIRIYVGQTQFYEWYSRLDIEEILVAEKGEKARYAEGTPDISQGRQYPINHSWEQADIDSTSIDLNFGNPGGPVRKIFYTKLTDVHSGIVLADWCHYEGCSHKSTLVVLYICFLRHGRLPLRLGRDNGPEFKNSYCESVLFDLKIDVVDRRVETPRDGALTESQFMQIWRRCWSLMDSSTDDLKERWPDPKKAKQIGYIDLRKVCMIMRYFWSVVHPQENPVDDPRDRSEIFEKEKSPCPGHHPYKRGMEDELLKVMSPYLNRKYTLRPNGCIEIRNEEFYCREHYRLMRKYAALKYGKLEVKQHLADPTVIFVNIEETWYAFYSVMDWPYRMLPADEKAILVECHRAQLKGRRRHNRAVRPTETVKRLIEACRGDVDEALFKVNLRESQIQLLRDEIKSELHVGADFILRSISETPPAPEPVDDCIDGGIVGGSEESDPSDEEAESTKVKPKVPTKSKGLPILSQRKPKKRSE